MIDSFGDMPSHPLLVHIPVVLVPLAAIGVLLMALWPASRRSLGVVVPVLAALGAVGGILASSSGEALEDDYREAGQTISTTVRDHAELGETARLLSVLFLLAVLAWMLVARWVRRAGDERATAALKRPRAVVLSLAVLASVGGVAATVSVVQAGHSGASSVWEQPAP